MTPHDCWPQSRRTVHWISEQQVIAKRDCSGRPASAMIVVMASQIRFVTLDCADPSLLGEFWAAVLDWTIAAADEWGAVVQGLNPRLQESSSNQYPKPRRPRTGCTSMSGPMTTPPNWTALSDWARLYRHGTVQ
jgi:hypothetical protein